MKKTIIFFLLIVQGISIAFAQGTYPYFPPSQNFPSSSSSDEILIKTTLFPGLFNLSATPLSSNTIVPTENQEGLSSWTIGLTINDLRGSGSGWQVHMNLPHLTTTTAPSPAAYNSSPLIRVSPSYRYQGWWGESPNNPCKITITIANSGNVGTAKFTARLSGGTSCVDSNINPQTQIMTQLLDANIGGGRLLIDFPSGNYMQNDSYEILFDMIDYRRCRVTPQTVSGLSNSNIHGVSRFQEQIAAGTATLSDNILLSKAETATGIGSYQQNIEIQCTIHQNPLTGVYRSSLSFTIL